MFSRPVGVVRVVGLGVALAALWAPVGASAAPSVYVASLLTNGAGGVFQYDAGLDGSLMGKTPVAVSAGNGPFGIAISPDGRSAYVVNSGTNGPGGVSQYDVGADGSLTPKATATVEAGNAPRGIAVSPDGRSVYVVNGATNGVGGVSQYDVGLDGTLTPKLTATVAAGSGPFGVAVSPDGRSAYVANDNASGAGAVSQYDVGLDGSLTAKAAPTASGGSHPFGVAVSPDGRSVYVTNSGASTGANGVSQYTAGVDGSLTPKAPAAVNAVNAPAGLAVSPDGRSLYAVNAGTNGAGGISQYDIGADGSLTAKAIPAVAAGNGPNGVAVSSDGRSVYVANTTTNGAGGVSQYDAAGDGSLTPKATASASAGNGPVAIAVSPAHSPVAAFSASSAVAGSATAFNATASSAQGGTIRRYGWSFGDGQSAPDGGPTPSHIYTVPGVYTATLTVSNGCPSSSFVFTGQTALCVGSPTASTTQTFTVAPAPTSPISPAPTPTPPIVTKVAQSHSSWRAGGRLAAFARKGRPPVGTTFSFALNEQASVRFAFTQQLAGRKVKGKCVAQTKQNRRGGACKRTVTRGTLAFTGHSGPNRISFQGRMSRTKKLGPGRYTLIITATNGAGQHSSPKALSFTIVK
jgi:6-phosphogluconolactonase (cycloisomerase 2 family)